MKKTKKIILMLATIIFIVSFYAINMSKGWTNDGFDNWQYIDENGVYATDTLRSSGDDKYYLDGDGMMVRDYLLEDYSGGVYYFDDDGKMVTNTWVAVDPSQVVNQMDNPPSIYLYYFGTNGKAYKSSMGVTRKTIDGKKYLFNENGQMLFGWLNETGDRYDEANSDEDPFVGYCYFAGDETDGVLREGWTEYEEGSVEDEYYLRQSLWFYFKPNDNKKVCATSTGELLKRKINNKHYAFDENGVMVEGWDTDTIDPNKEDSTLVTKNYFSEDIDNIGKMHKKEWIFAAPSKLQHEEDHDQEVSRWFYAQGSGDIVKGEMKKINTGYYAFNSEGIMKKGLCIITKGGKKYVDCIDVEKTDGKDFIISRHYISMDKTDTSDEFEVFDDTKNCLYYFMEDETDDFFGKRMTGEVTVAFGDDDYTFMSKSTGEYEGYKSKKYYQNGIKLKAETAYGLGLVFLGYASSSNAQSLAETPIYYKSTHNYAMPDKNHDNIKSDYMVINDYDTCLNLSAFPVFAVVDTLGNRAKKSKSVKKDKSGNYWMIGEGQTLVNIYEVPIRYKKGSDGSRWQFKSEYLKNATASNARSKSEWIDFGTKDIYGKTCVADRTSKDENPYVVELDDYIALNFRFAD